MFSDMALPLENWTVQEREEKKRTMQAKRETWPKDDYRVPREGAG
jgi:hypothetical protein